MQQQQQQALQHEPLQHEPVAGSSGSSYPAASVGASASTAQHTSGGRWYQQLWGDRAAQAGGEEEAAAAAAPGDRLEQQQHHQHHRDVSSDAGEQQYSASALARFVGHPPSTAGSVADSAMTLEDRELAWEGAVSSLTGTPGPAAAMAGAGRAAAAGASLGGQTGEFPSGSSAGAAGAAGGYEPVQSSSSGALPAVGGGLGPSGSGTWEHLAHLNLQGRGRGPGAAVEDSAASDDDSLVLPPATAARGGRARSESSSLAGTRGSLDAATSYHVAAAAAAVAAASAAAGAGGPGSRSAAAALRRQDSASMQEPFGDEPEEYWHLAMTRQGLAHTSQQLPAAAGAALAGQTHQPQRQQQQQQAGASWEVDSDALLRQGSSGSLASGVVSEAGATAVPGFTSAQEQPAAAAAAIMSGPGQPGSQATGGRLLQSPLAAGTAAPAAAAGLHSQRASAEGSRDDDGLQVVARQDSATELQPSMHEAVATAPDASSSSAHDTLLTHERGIGRLGSGDSGQRQLTAAGASGLGLGRSLSMPAPAGASDAHDLLAQARRVVLSSRASDAEAEANRASSSSSAGAGAGAGARAGVGEGSSSSYHYLVAGVMHNDETLEAARQVVLGGRLEAGSSGGSGPLAIPGRLPSGGLRLAGAQRQVSGRVEYVLDSPRERAEMDGLLAAAADTHLND